VIFDRPSIHLQSNNVSVPKQFGFGKYITIEIAVFKLTACFYCDKSLKAVEVLFYDLVIAFDGVSHKVLLGKLFCFGTCGVNVQWFDFSHKEEDQNNT
jgi:hypothetical protein